MLPILCEWVETEMIHIRNYTNYYILQQSTTPSIDDPIGAPDISLHMTPSYPHTFPITYRRQRLATTEQPPSITRRAFIRLTSLPYKFPDYHTSFLFDSLKELVALIETLNMTFVYTMLLSIWTWSLPCN